MSKTNYENEKVSIIFPTYNGWVDTKECLKSILRQNFPQNNLDVFVVDNNSQDLTPSYIQKYFPNVKLVTNNQNLGYAKAVNIGIKKSRGGYVLLSNNDIVLDKNYILNMVKLAQSDPKIGVIGSMVYLKNPKGKIGFNGLKINPYLGYHQYDLNNLNMIRDCDIPPAGGFFVRRSVFDKIGLLDEGFFVYFEDVDFCLRAKHHGYKVIFNPKSIAYHGHARTTLRENFETIVFRGYKSKWRCIFKNASLLEIISSLITQFTIIIVVQNIISSQKTFKPFLNGFIWNVRDLKETLKVRKKTYCKIFWLLHSS